MTVAGALRTRISPGVSSRLPQLGRQLVALAFWVLLPIVCLLILGNGVDKLIRHVDNVPAGIPGVMTVTVHNCRDACIAGGTFASSDGKNVIHYLPGLYSWQIGERHRAVYDPSNGDVIPLPAKWDATSTAVGMSGSIIFLALWGRLLYASLHRRSPAFRAMAGV